MNRDSIYPNSSSLDGKNKEEEELEEDEVCVNPESGEKLTKKSLRRPIIGIFTQPTRVNLECSFIPSSYVRWIEAAGGRVIPILYDLPNEELELTFQKLDGVLLPGGSESLERDTKFMEANVKVLELVKKENDEGRKFPLFATCQGFQILCIICPDVYGDPKNIPNYSPKEILFECMGTRRSSLQLDFDAKYVEDSVLFTENEFGSIFGNAVSTESVTLNSHKWGVNWETWERTGMARDFRITAMNRDVEGKEFISMFEHRSHPIYSVQFHPEKVSFEDQPLAINQNMFSNMFNLYLSQFFVEKARKNVEMKMKMKDKNKSKYYSNDLERDVEKLLIDNYQLVKEPQFVGYFRFVYYFKKIKYSRDKKRK